MPKGVYIRTKPIWNKGKKMSEETRQRLSIALSGENNPNFGKERTAETKRKIGDANRGRKRLDMIGNKFGHILKGKYVDEKSPGWKGEDVCYSAIHTWVIKRLGQPDTCEHCKTSNLSGKRIHWANIDHEYHRNLSDWLRLCAKCHYKYDLELRAL